MKSIHPLYLTTKKTNKINQFDKLTLFIFIFLLTLKVKPMILKKYFICV